MFDKLKIRQKNHPTIVRKYTIVGMANLWFKIRSKHAKFNNCKKQILFINCINKNYSQYFNSPRFFFYQIAVASLENLQKG